eukprot:jgi/Ulvmu1/9768/UM056_0008.1
MPSCSYMYPVRGRMRTIHTLAVCRLHCNPYDPDSKWGLVEVMSTAVAGPWHELEKGKGSTSDSYRRSQTGHKVGIKVVGDCKTK